MTLSRHQLLRLLPGSAVALAAPRFASGQPAGIQPFAQSRILTDLYGTENKFKAAVAGELNALGTTDTILDYLRQKGLELAGQVGGKALQWVSAELLNVFGLGGSTSDLDKIKDALLQIQKTQELILSKLGDLLIEVQFQHLVTRGYDSVQRIETAFESLQRLSEISGADERKREAIRIKDGALDPNQGAKLSLNTISDVMLGKDRFGQSQSLIKLFIDRWFSDYTNKQLRDDIPLATYTEKLDEWLHGVFVIQYMGIVQLANARIANGDFEILRREIADTVQRMTAQKELVAEAIPDWTRTLPDSLFNGQWYVVWALDLQNGRIDASQVMYGSPTTGSYLDRTVQFRDRHNNNGDEEWRFEKTGSSDTFTMRKRSQPQYLSNANYVTKEGDRIMVNDKGAKLRLVMVRTNNPAVKADAKRRDLYVPAIVLVSDSSDKPYLRWTRGGNNVVFTGSADQAVRVRILPARD